MIFKKFKSKIKNFKSGMTYLEMIIVLSIFSTVSGIVLFSYQEFQAKVDIKNLTNDIALRLVEAQKLSVAGKLSTTPPTVTPWKPSYGVYFNTTTPNTFVYFADLNNFDGCDAGCVPPYSLSGEVLEIVTITRGNSIPSDGIVPTGVGCPSTIQNLTIVFKRPNSSPTISSNPPLTCVPDFVTIRVTSPNNKTGTIKVYPSGRIQVD